MRSIWRFFSLLEVCIILLLTVCLVMAVGSLLLKGDAASSINVMPLFDWLRIAPVYVSWWLWLCVVLLFLLAVNTSVCSADVIVNRWERRNPFVVLAPQLMHAGFLLIMLAHLFSASGSYFEQVQVVEGSTTQLPTGQRIGIAAFSSITSQQGIPVRFAAELVPDLQNLSRRVTIAPNQPLFIDGYGVYLKQVETYPYRQALLEIHREPGAGAALAGAIMFALGNILVVWQRSRSRGPEP